MLLVAAAVYLTRASSAQANPIVVTGGGANVSTAKTTASWTVVADGSFNFGSTTGSASVNGALGTSASVILSQGNASTAPFLIASASAPSTPKGIPAEANASMTYMFEIVGPAAGSPLIDISSGASANADGTRSFATATGFWGGINANGTFTSDHSLASVSATPTDENPSVVALNQLYEVDANESYGISMSVSAGDTNGTESAFFDPTISIDPSTRDASAYSIIFSSGIEQLDVGSPAEVPDTCSTIELLGLGFLGFGLYKKLGSVPSPNA
jgi:hypothetical protein